MSIGFTTGGSGSGEYESHSGYPDSSTDTGGSSQEQSPGSNSISSSTSSPKKHYEYSQEGRPSSMISDLLREQEERKKKESDDEKEKSAKTRRKKKRRTMLALAGLRLGDYRRLVREAKLGELQGQTSGKQLLELTLAKSQDIDKQVYEQVRLAGETGVTKGREEQGETSEKQRITDKEKIQKQMSAMYSTMLPIEIGDDIIRTTNALEKTRKMKAAIKGNTNASEDDKAMINAILENGEIVLEAKEAALQKHNDQDTRETALKHIAESSKKEAENETTSEQLTDKDSQRQLRKDRAYYRQKIKETRRRIQQLEQRGEQTLPEEEKQELEQKRRDLTEYALLQAATISETRVYDKRLIDLLTGEDAATRGEVSKLLSAKNSPLLNSEKTRLQEWQTQISSPGNLAQIKTFFGETSESGNLADLIKKIKTADDKKAKTTEIIDALHQDKDKVKALLDFFYSPAAHPELIGRLELLSRQEGGEGQQATEQLSDKDKETLTFFDTFLEEIKENEEWRREGPRAERVNGFKSEAIQVVLAIGLDQEVELSNNDQSSTDTLAQDLEELAQSFGFDLSNKENKDIQDVIEKAKNINGKRLNAVNLIEDSDISDEATETEAAAADEKKQKEFLDSLENQLRVNLNKALQSEGAIGASQELQQIQQTKALTTLLASGHLDFRVTPTGLAIVVNRYGIKTQNQKASTEAIRQLYELLGQNKESTSSLSVNLSQKSLDALFGANSEHKFSKEETPTVSIIISQGIATEQINQTRHELVHAIQEQLLGTFYNADNAEARAGVELAAMLMEGRTALDVTADAEGGKNAQAVNQLKYQTKLSHLYLENPQDDEEKKGLHKRIKALIMQVESIIRGKRKEENFTAFDEMMLREELSSLIASGIMQEPESWQGGELGNQELLERYKEISAILAKEYGVEADLGNAAYNESDYDGNNRLTDQQRTLAEAGMLEFAANGGAPNTTSGRSYRGGSRGFTGTIKDQRSIANIAHDINKKRNEPNPDISSFRRGHFFYDPEGNAFMTWNEMVGRSRIGKAFHIPFAGNLPLPGVSLFMPRGYGSAGRAFGAYLHRAPFGSRRRTIAQRDYGEFVGADASKFAKMFNPGMEYLLREHFPWAHRHWTVSKEYERLPTQMEFNSLEQWGNEGTKMVFGSLVSELRMDPQVATRIIGRLPGRKFEYNLEQRSYKFAPDLELGLDRITEVSDDAVNHTLSRMLENEELAKVMRKNITAEQILNSQGAIKMRYENWRNRPGGSLIGKALAPGRTAAALLLPTGPSGFQAARAKWFKDFAHRDDLSWVQNQLKWEQEIGKQARDYWQKRDGTIMLAALQAESDDVIARTNGAQHFSMFDLTNLVYRAESMDHDKPGDCWQINKTDKVQVYEIMENGKKKRIEVLPGDYLLDKHGNLVPKGVSGGYSEKTKAFEASKPDEDYIWQRIVGDRENPHLRFIKLNSADGRDIAKTLAGDDDIQNVGENIRLRTDGIKWAMRMYEEAEMGKILKEGIPATRRYSTDFLRDENGEPMYDKETGELLDIPKLSEGFKTANNAKEVFDRDQKGNIIGVNTAVMDHFNNAISQVLDPTVASEYSIKPTDSPERVAQKIQRVMTSIHHRGVDGHFTSIFEFDKDPTWQSQWRDELAGIAPMDEDLAKESIKTHNDGYGELQRRLETGRNFYNQWMARYSEISHNERRQYKTTTFYKGLEALMKQGTNFNIVLGFTLMALTANPAIFSTLVLPSFMLKMYGKPFAARKSERALARRLKSLKAQDELLSLHGLMSKIEAGEILTRAEEKLLYNKNEALIFMAEDVGATKEDKDWEEKQDIVQRGWSNLLNFIDDKYGQG